MHACMQHKQVRRIEIIKGYGVYLTQRQLDEALDQSCSSPTRLVRNLMSCFFLPTLMAKSSYFGTRRFPKLNEDIVGACFSKSWLYEICMIIKLCHMRTGFVQKRYPEVGRSTLVNAKCGNHRRAGTKVAIHVKWTNQTIHFADLIIDGVLIIDHTINILLDATLLHVGSMYSVHRLFTTLPTTLVTVSITTLSQPCHNLLYRFRFQFEKECF